MRACSRGLNLSSVFFSHNFSFFVLIVIAVYVLFNTFCVVFLFFSFFLFKINVSFLRLRAQEVWYPHFLCILSCLFKPHGALFSYV